MMMSDVLKKCKKCKTIKNIKTDFYNNGKYVRWECKKCYLRTKVRVVAPKESSKKPAISNEAKRAYMREYYAKNRDKYISYRMKFDALNPEYQKNYREMKKNEKIGK
jgi:hypothetical protein